MRVRGGTSRGAGLYGSLRYQWRMHVARMTTLEAIEAEWDAAHSRFCREIAGSVPTPLQRRQIFLAEVNRRMAFHAVHINYLEMRRLEFQMRLQELDWEIDAERLAWRMAEGQNR